MYVGIESWQTSLLSLFVEGWPRGSYCHFRCGIQWRTLRWEAVANRLGYECLPFSASTKPRLELVLKSFRWMYSLKIQMIAEVDHILLVGWPYSCCGSACIHDSIDDHATGNPLQMCSIPRWIGGYISSAFFCFVSKYK